MEVYNLVVGDLKTFEAGLQQGTITMGLTSTLCLCAITLLFQNVSSVCIDPSYDLIAPWARTFLAWRDANTNVAGRFSPLLRNIPKLYSTAVWEDNILADPYFPADLAAQPGVLAVKSSSKGPIGISVLSENIIEGPLAVAGKLPFLGTVALGGALPTAGSGAVSYGTGKAKDALLAAKALLSVYNRNGALKYNKFDRFELC